jgi:hypothetical protein
VVWPHSFDMKYATRYLILFGCWVLGSMALTPMTALASPTKQTETATDKLHTPPERSAEREAVLDGLRQHWQASRNPDGVSYRGRITFHVGYSKVHNGWAWVNAEPRSSVPKERFPENSGFLLRLQTGRWQVMETPPMMIMEMEPLVRAPATWRESRKCTRRLPQTSFRWRSAASETMLPRRARSGWHRF